MTRKEALRAALLEYVRESTPKPAGYGDYPSVTRKHDVNCESDADEIMCIIEKKTPIYGHRRRRDDFPDETGLYLVGTDRSVFKVAIHDTESGWFTVSGDPLEPEFIGWWPLPEARYE